MSDILMEEFVKMGETIGKPEHEVRDLARQLRAVYPLDWETLLAEKLNSNKESVERERRIEEKRAKIRALEIQLQTRDYAELEKNLDKRIKELEKAGAEGVKDEVKVPRDESWRRGESLNTVDNGRGEPGADPGAVPGGAGGSR